MSRRHRTRHLLPQLRLLVQHLLLRIYLILVLVVGSSNPPHARHRAHFHLHVALPPDHLEVPLSLGFLPRLRAAAEVKDLLQGVKYMYHAGYCGWDHETTVGGVTNGGNLRRCARMYAPWMGTKRGGSMAFWTQLTGSTPSNGGRDRVQQDAGY